MVSGPGGLARGLQAGIGLGQRQQQIQSQREQSRTERMRQRRQEVREQIDKTVTAISENAKDFREAGRDPRNDPEAQRVIAPLVQTAIGMAQDASELGPGISPQQTAARIEAALGGPSREDVRQEEAADVGAQRRAELEAEKEFEKPTRTVIVQGGDPENKLLDLGIRKGEQARVRLTLDEEGNPVQGDVLSGPGSGQTINIGDQPRVKEQSKRQSQTIKDGRRAVGLESSFRQMSELLAGGVETGRLPSATLGLQALAEDLNFDLGGWASSVGIDIGDVSNQEEFNRLAQRVVIESFEKFKGNLNREEVKIAENAFAQLGTTEPANIDAISAGLAATTLARERARDAVGATDAEFQALEREMLSDEASERFLELKSQFEKDIREQFVEARQDDGERTTRDQAQSQEIERPASVPEDSRFIEKINETITLDDGTVVEAGSEIWMRGSGDNAETFLVTPENIRAGTR